MASLTDFDRSEAERILKDKGPSAFYGYMEGLGHKYATLANGVFVGNTIAGNAAMGHMRAIADRDGVVLDDKVVSKIRHDMAAEYLKTYADRVERGEGHHEIERKEAQVFHDEVFKKNGLSKDAWTMTTIFQFGSDNEKDELWKDTLNAAGDNDKEIALSLKVVGRMVGISDELQKKQENLLGIYNRGIQSPLHPSLPVIKHLDTKALDKVSADMKAVQEWLKINALSPDNILEVFKYKSGLSKDTPPEKREIDGRNIRGGEQTQGGLMHYLEPHQKAVQEAIKVPLNPHQMAALMSLHADDGTEAFKASPLVKTLNAGNYAAVPVELAKWDGGKGQGREHLPARRMAEIEVWNRGGEQNVQVHSGVSADSTTVSAENGISTGQAANLRQRRTAMAKAFRDNPEEAVKTYPELASAHHVLEAVADAAGRVGPKTRAKAAIITQQKLVHHIHKGLPIPAPKTAIKAVASTMKAAREMDA